MKTHKHTATCKQIARVVLPPVHNLACVCSPAFFHRVEIFSPDETCIYLGFSPRPQALKSNKRGSSILFCFLHKTPSRENAGNPCLLLHHAFLLSLPAMLSILCSYQDKLAEISFHVPPFCLNTQHRFTALNQFTTRLLCGSFPPFFTSCSALFVL